AQPVTTAELEEAYLANAIFDAHHDDPEFGYRFLADEVHDAGFAAAERTVWKICSDNGWWSVFGKKKTRKHGKAGTPAHDDLVRRDFTAPGPNQLWLTDLTEPRRSGKVAGCRLHSDRGSQFRSRQLQQSLWRHQMLGSMGQVGSAGDNAAMESFFSLLQRNVLDRQRWHTREQLRIAIITWIERTYHRRSRQARLGRLTPIEFETIMTTPTNQAA
ncbi:MAG TPA: IS3 family transposase, partial [Rhodopila sp.]|nr:IS3 family transposase [Rhodopila sp.]